MHSLQWVGNAARAACLAAVHADWVGLDQYIRQYFRTFNAAELGIEPLELDAEASC